MKQVLFSVFMLFFSLSMTYGQMTISGKVVDNSGESLIGANVTAKGAAGVGTITDLDGMYKLSIPAGTTKIVFSYTGYESQEVTLGSSNVVNVTLSEGKLLDEVVVTALGVSRTDKSLGYATQKVEGSSINNANTNSMVSALSGKVSGLQVVQSSGSAGGASRMVIRGQTNFNGNNEALVVVDGIRVSNAENHSERSLGGVSVSNRAMDINPADIESVNVLKGAAASALYGAEGANGVILITTKRGKSSGGKINVEYGISYGTSSVNKNHELSNTYLQGSGGQYAGPETGASGSWGPKASDVSWNGDASYIYDKNGKVVLNSDPTAKTPFKAYDPLDFFVNGNSIKNNLSVSGGGDVITYRFTFGNLKENGVTPNNTFNRTTLGASSTAKFLDNKLKLSTGINFTNSGGRRVQQGSNVSGLMLGLLRTPISFDNSGGYTNAQDVPGSYIFGNGRQRNYRGGGGYDNPYWNVNNTPFNDNVNRFIGTLSATYEFNKWFSLGFNVGKDVYSDNRLQAFEINSRAYPTGRIVDDTYLYDQLDAYIFASGNGQLTDDLSLNYTVGNNLFSSNLKNNTIFGSGINFQGFMSLNNVSSIQASTAKSNSKTYGIYGSTELGYKNYLFLNLTARKDYLSSLIVPGLPFKSSDISILYPSASLGFVFTEVLKNTGPLSYGKARLSYAGVGGGAPSSYLTSTNFVVPVAGAGTVNDVNDGWTNGIGFPFGGVSGNSLDAVQGSQKLIPSFTSEIEGGLDLRFYNGRLNLDFAAYSRISSDQITVIPVAGSTGYQRAVINSGELRTKGFDITLGIEPIKTTNFSWNFSANITKWKSLVWDMPVGVDNQYIDGFTGGAIYNIAPERDANGNVTKRYEYGQIFGGAWLRDQSGNLVIDDDPNSDYYGYPIADPINRVIGNPNPDFLMTFTNGFNYKGISLNAQVDWKKGGDMWNGTRGALVFFGRAAETDARGTEKVFEGVNGRYDADGNLQVSTTKNTIKATLDQGWYQDNGGGFGAVSEDFVEDASFVRLANVSLGYTFTKNKIKSLPFQEIGLSVSGNNLMLITDYKGIDPSSSLVGSSSNGQGLEYFNLPSTKSVFVNLNIKF